MARRSQGIPATQLDDADLARELKHLYRTRAATFFGGSSAALRTHSERMTELEFEYARRKPEAVEPDPRRTRAGARARAGQRVSGGVPRSAMRRATARSRARPTGPTPRAAARETRGRRRKSRSGMRG